MGCHQHTVRATLGRWQKQGLRGLGEAPGRGIKPKGKESDLDCVINCLKNKPKTYKSQQLAKNLKQER